MSDHLPGSQPEKLALLRGAAALGDRLRPVLTVGASASRLREAAATEEGVTVTPTATGLSIRFGPHVRWDATLDGGCRVIGYSASGYGELMDALGIDFAGRPHVPGNGH